MKRAVEFTVRDSRFVSCFHAVTDAVVVPKTCSSSCAGLVVLRMSLALATSAAVPWATRRYLFTLMAVSYLRTLSFGIPTLQRAAPKTLTPPTTTALSNAATMAAETGPATRSGPTPGTQKKAAPNSKPQNPPHNAPILPQYFIRSPLL